MGLNSVVLDTASTRALLEIAYDEGLLQEEGHKTDLFLASLKRRPLTVRKQVDSTLIKTPLLGETPSIVGNTLPQKQMDQAGEIALFQIVTRDLIGFTPRTLWDALKGANNPASQSLRQHIPLWLEQILKFDLREEELIRQEIAKATKELEKASKWNCALTTQRR